MSKKIISFAIVVFMVAAMIPMSIVSANNADVVYSFRYDFSMKADPGNNALGNYDVNNIIYEQTKGKWEHSGFVYQTGTSWKNTVKDTRLELMTSGGSAWVALKINVPLSGNYDLEYGYIKIMGNQSATGDVYVFPEGTVMTPGVKFGTGNNNIASKGTKIASGIVYNSSGGDTNIEDSVEYKNISLEKGENLIVFVATAGGKTYPAYLTLTSAGATSTDYADAYVGEISVEETTLDVETNPTTTATVSAYNTTTKETIATDKIKFRSSDEDVVKVSADGTVTAVGAGKAMVYATCTEPSTGNIIGKEIAVTAPTYKVAYTFDNRMVEGQSGVVNVGTVNDYALTRGLWKYRAVSLNRGTSELKNNRLGISMNAIGGYMALSINVPKTDIYDIDYSYFGIANTGGQGDVYIIPGETSLSNIAEAKSAGVKIASVDYSKAPASTKSYAETVKNVSLTKGENVLLFEVTAEGSAASSNKYDMYPSALVLTNASGDANAQELETVYVGTVMVDKTELNPRDNTTAVAKVYTADTTADGTPGGVAVTSGITFKSSLESVATVDAETGEVTAVGAGKAVISAEIENGSIIGSEVTVSLAEDPELTEAFTIDDKKTVEAVVYTDIVKALSYVDGEKVAEGVTATAIQKDDGTYQMSTSTTDNDNTFLYWVKGMDGGAKRVVSCEESFTYAPTGNVVNYLIAVYEKTGATAAKAEFYNGNGLLYGKVETENGTTPKLPTMAGYGTAKWWKTKDGITYAGNAPITVSDTMMLVAEYDDPAESITITTNANCTTNKPGEKYAYGEKVTCTPTGTGTFYAWIKDGEIVSTNSKEYVFYAWKDCNVEAIYKEHTPITSIARKIMIDVFGNNVMAEFIGFDDAVEKGIILGDTKIAMTSKKTQFTVELGDATSAKGYAVVKNNDGTYTEYIDGSYTGTAE